MYLCCSFQYETISLFKWLERVNARFVHAVEYRLQNVVQTVDTDAKKKILISETTAECSVFNILEIRNIWKWLDKS